ncbi:hypothetical protein [Halpernia sp.]|uniref:hypothetical protein n=1 Tax=Halpernia sp. TaxID=2782209 RepID=UPI003A92E9BD
MKKLLLIATLGIAGMMSAKSTKQSHELNFKNEKMNSLLNLVVSPPDINLVKITSECGIVFYLNSNDYSTSKELEADAVKWSAIKCNAALTPP